MCGEATLVYVHVYTQVRCMLIAARRCMHVWECVFGLVQGACMFKALPACDHERPSLVLQKDVHLIETLSCMMDVISPWNTARTKNSCHEHRRLVPKITILKTGSAKSVHTGRRFSGRVLLCISALVFALR